MAINLEPIPVDSLTGIVRPIYVTPEHYTGQNPLGPDTHFHHHVFNKRREELQDTAGKIVRRTYGQRLPKEMHMCDYSGSLHDIFRQPEKIPQTKAEKHLMAMLHISKVIPRVSIDLVGGSYKDRELNDQEHDFISSSRITNYEDSDKARGIYQKHKLGRFFLEYALEQDIHELVSRKERDRYLGARRAEDLARTRELGNLIICRAIDESIQPVRSIYIEAKNAGMVSPRQAGLRSSIYKFLPAHEFGSYYDQLEETLQYSLAAAA
jgi:hypothetical protein